MPFSSGCFAALLLLALSQTFCGSHQPILPLDSDSDGIVDVSDKCPDVAGPISGKGCPDQDGDRIQDSLDKCPTSPVTFLMEGCADDDSDGITDDVDACPDVAEDRDGFADDDGCPEKDNDLDGIEDEKDLCAVNYGPAAWEGCPSKTLLLTFQGTKISRNSLGDLEGLLPALKGSGFKMIEVQGHAQGKDAMRLSVKRAAAVTAFLTKNGFSKRVVRPVGFGDTRPVVAQAQIDALPKGKERDAAVSKNLRTEIVLGFSSTAVGSATLPPKTEAPAKGSK